MTPPAHARRCAVLAVAATCAVIQLMASAAAPAASASPDAAPKAPIAWTVCGENLECANVRVPLDWARPDGPRIRLAVIRHLASRPDERIGSLFFNPGGPGG